MSPESQGHIILIRGYHNTLKQFIIVEQKKYFSLSMAFPDNNRSRGTTVVLTFENCCSYLHTKGHSSPTCNTGLGNRILQAEMNPVIWAYSDVKGVIARSTVLHTLLANIHISG